MFVMRPSQLCRKPVFLELHRTDYFVGLRPIPRSTRDRHCVASCALRAGTAFAMTGVAAPVVGWLDCFASLAMTGKGVIARPQAAAIQWVEMWPRASLDKGGWIALLACGQSLVPLGTATAWRPAPL